jgi:uncharacterized protein (TIGR03382 family)
METTDRDEFGIEGITIRLLNVCGNGIVDKEEACDEGLANIDTGACTTTCAEAACGDGFVQDGVEECDDMNVEDGDGCAADCTTEDPDPDTGTGNNPDSTAGSSDEGDDDTGTATNSTVTDASATNPTTTDPDDDGSEGDDDTGGEDDDDVGCACNSSGGNAPILGALGLLVLGIARRRRR